MGPETENADLDQKHGISLERALDFKLRKGPSSHGTWDRGCSFLHVEAGLRVSVRRILREASGRMVGYELR